MRVGHLILQPPDDEDEYRHWYETEFAYAGELLLREPANGMQFRGRTITNVEFEAGQAALAYGWMNLAAQWTEAFQDFLENKIDDNFTRE